MKSLKLFLKLFFLFNKYTAKIFLILRHGQSEEYEIMQLAHRLEKGLINKNPKTMWGWEKAERLAFLLNRNRDKRSFSTGVSVLQSYLTNKAEVKDEKYLAIELKEKYSLPYSPLCGGLMTINEPLFNEAEVLCIKKFINSRHSTRNFDSKEIDYDKVNEAIQLAMRCPSACNRQPYKVYIISDKIRSAKLGVSDESAASLYITGSIDAFAETELMDWVVSPSIFAAYLTLTLHCYGYGSCVYRKELIGDRKYNKSVSMLCDIPNTEQLILELRIGQYPQIINAAVSNRFTVDDICKIINK